MPTPTPLIPGSMLTTSAVAYYTVPTQDQKVKQVQIGMMRFLNTDTVARTVTVHLVPAGGTPSDANARFKTLSIEAASAGNPPPMFFLADVLLPGWSIYALASVGAKVTISASGVSSP